MMAHFLESKRLILRSFSVDDRELLKDLDSNPAVMKYLNGGRPSTDVEVDAGLERILALNKKHDHKLGLWATYEKSSDAFIGWFLLRPDKKTPENLNELELGYRFKAAFWGNGYATEMSEELMKYAFLMSKTDVVFAKTLKKNVASSNVMKKIGLVFHSEFIETEFLGSDKTAVRYQIARENWLLKFKKK